MISPYLLWGASGLQGWVEVYYLHLILQESNEKMTVLMFCKHTSYWFSVILIAFFSFGVHVF